MRPEQCGVVNRRLRDRPIDAWAPPGSTGLRTLTRYLLDRTAPSDRVLVTWYAPGVPIYAEQGFAGGQAYFERGSFGSVADQRLTIERMHRQSVPIVLALVRGVASDVGWFDMSRRVSFRC